MEEYFEIGQIVNTSGLKGVLKVKPFTDDINKFMNSFEMTQKMMKKLTTNKGAMKKMMKGFGDGNIDLGDITKNLK